MNKRSEIFKDISRSPLRLALTFLFIIPFVNFILALVLQILPPMPVIFWAFIDSTLIVILLTPIVYYLVFRPVLNDIAKREKAEELLRESEEKYKNLFEEDLTGNFVMSAEGIITDCNYSFLEIFGYSDKQEIIGKNVVILYEDATEFERVKNQLLEVKTLKNHEAIRKCRNGKLINIIENKIADFNDQGELIRIKGYVYDITERKLVEIALVEREASLEELNATKDKFFSIIAHDLKNPFNGIIGFSTMLKEQIREKDYKGIGDYASIIQDSAQKVLDLLINLLDWSRSQTGQMEFKPEQIEIDIIITEVVELLDATAQQKSITLSGKTTSNIMVFADKDMVSLILRNLVSNAIKFTNPGGMIVISAEQNQDELTMSVSDNGVGMTNETMKKLFRIAENKSTAGTQNETGTGLGLILCKEFVEKQGGRIWVESEPGTGSSFRFTLPKNSVPAKNIKDIVTNQLGQSND